MSGPASDYTGRPFCKIGAKGHQESQSDVLRESDRDFIISVPIVYRDVDRDSRHSAAFYFSLGKFPVDVEVLALTFANQIDDRLLIGPSGTISAHPSLFARTAGAVPT